jgi:hypothetical protein
MPELWLWYYALVVEANRAGLTTILISMPCFVSAACRATSCASSANTRYPTFSTRQSKEWMGANALGIYP